MLHALRFNLLKMFSILHMTSNAVTSYKCSDTFNQIHVAYVHMIRQLAADANCKALQTDWMTTILLTAASTNGAM